MESYESTTSLRGEFPSSRSQLHKRLWLGTWQPLWSEMTNEWKIFFSMFLWFRIWPLEANFNINHHQKPLQPAGTSKSSSRKFFTTPKRFWQTEAMLSAWRCRQISWAWKFGVYFQTNPLHFAKQGWAKPRSKRMIQYLESEHLQILSILCPVGICWGRVKLRPALALLCRSFSPMQSNLRCQARKTSEAGLVP